MTRHILAISGKMRSGKDTFAAEFLSAASERGVLFQRVGFADALKAEVAEMHGVPLEQTLEDRDTWRPEWIRHGQARRAEDVLYWVKKALATPGNLVIPDMRFPNEMIYLREHGGRFLRVESLISYREQRGTIIDDPVTENQLDNLEVGPDGWDWFLFNNATKYAFQQDARALSIEILNIFAGAPPM